MYIDVGIVTISSIGTVMAIIKKAVYYTSTPVLLHFKVNMLVQG